MASSLLYDHIPIRSISLPSRLNPTSHEIESQITNLRSSTTTPLESNTIQVGLIRVAELFNSIDNIIHAPLNRQSSQQNLIDEALDGSVALLDTCGVIRDLLFAMKQRVHELQSALRRRSKDSRTVQMNVDNYILFRRKAGKDIKKSLKLLKRMEVSGEIIYERLCSDHRDLSYVIKVTREARNLTISMFRALLMFFSTPVSNDSSWLVLSRVKSGFASSAKLHEKIVNEVGSVDVALRQGKFDVQEIQRQLQVVNERISGFESKLDNVYRCLIQNRSSFLNLVIP